MDPELREFKRVIEAIQAQEKTWKEAGFNELMERPLENSDDGFLSQDNIDSLFEGVSGFKISSGISRSKQGTVEINWNEGYIQLAFPGEGSKFLRMDIQGLFIGNRNFASAPFSVDMDGNVVASTATLGQYLSKTGTSQSFTGSINVLNSRLLMDGVNGRIVVNDGTTNRIVIGDV